MTYTRLRVIKENYQQAVSDIKVYQKNSDPDMQALTLLLLETDANPYSFLPDSWAARFNTADGFASLLHHIHHALYDDGEISFPVIGGEPKISFIGPYEQDYASLILKEHGYNRSALRYSHDPEIVMCSDALDFVLKFKEYHKNILKHWFTNDVRAHGVEFAVRHYSKYKNFDPAWALESESKDATT